MELKCENCGERFEYNDEAGYSKSPPICGVKCDFYWQGRRAAIAECAEFIEQERTIEFAKTMSNAGWSTELAHLATRIAALDKEEHETHSSDNR